MEDDHNEETGIAASPALHFIVFHKNCGPNAFDGNEKVQNRGSDQIDEAGHSKEASEPRRGQRLASIGIGEQNELILGK